VQGFGMGMGRGAIERTFSPEFRNRLDAWIAFNPLTYDDIVRVVDKFVNEVKELLIEKEVTLSLTDNARTWFADKGFDRQYGARPMARIIKQKIREPLADELLFGVLEHGGKVSVDVVDGELKIGCEKAVEPPAASDAEPKPESKAEPKAESKSKTKPKSEL
jgi:ATP-dependent Clp protease ATP-binding subunit ClpA